MASSPDRSAPRRGQRPAAGQEGVSPGAAEKAVRQTARALTRAGPLTRRQLRERLAAQGSPWSGSAMLHRLFLANRRGLVVRGPMAGKKQALVLSATGSANSHRFPGSEP